MPENKYLNAALSLNKRDNQSTPSLFAVESKQPDSSARASELSKRLNIPQSLIESDLPAFEGMAKKKSDQDALTKAPSMSKWLSNPDNAAVAQDDIESLSNTEQRLRELSDIKSFYGQTALTKNVANPLKAGTLRLEQVMSSGAAVNYSKRIEALSQIDRLIQEDKFGEAVSLGRKLDDGSALLTDYARSQDPVIREGIRARLNKNFMANINSISGAQQKLSVIPQDPKLQAAMTEGTAGAILSAVASDPAILARVGLESAPLMIPGIGASFVVGPVGGFGIGSFMIENNLAITESFADAGVDTSNPDALKAAFANPVLMAKAKEKGIKRGIPIGIFDALSGGVASKMLAPAKVMGRSLGPTAKEFANIGLQMPTQAALGASGELFGQLADTGKVNMAEVALEGFAEFSTAPVDVTVAALSSGRFKQFMTDLHQSAASSKLLGRSPDKFSDAMTKAAEDAGIENVYTDVEAFDEYFQSQGVDPREYAQSVFGDTVEYDRAKAAGHDIQIPTQVYASKIAPSEHASFFESEVRLDPNSMNVREMEAFEQEEITSAEQVQPENTTILDNMTQQLQRTGYDEKTAKTYASTVDSFFKTMAVRSGLDPVELFDKYGIAVRRPDIDGLVDQDGVTYNQEIKTETPEFKNWFGDSKVVDEAGGPLVVYKGMYPYDWTQETKDYQGPEIEQISRKSEFPSFLVDEPGVKIAGFFGSKEVANGFAESGGHGQAVYPVYLSFKTPLAIDAKGRMAGEMQFGESGSEFRDGIRSGKYDSVIIKNTADEGDLYVALDPTQIKSAIGNRGTFDPNDPRILYQGENKRNLYVAHNLSEENLKHAVELGGLAAPSLAVGNIDAGALNSFGDITLLASPEIINDKSVPFFDADVYSPRQPRAVHDIDRKEFNKLIDELQANTEIGDIRVPDIQSLEDTQGEVALYRNEALQYNWLKQQGKAPKPKKSKIDAQTRKAVNLNLSRIDMMNSDKVRKIAEAHYRDQVEKVNAVDSARGNRYSGFWFEENGSLKTDALREFVDSVHNYVESGGIDTYATREAINAKMRSSKTQKEFEKYANGIFSKMLKGKEIFVGTDNMGRNKYKPYTLDNVVKNMIKDIRGGEGFNYGNAGQVRSSIAEKINSIPAAQKRRDKIIPSSDMENIKEEANDKLQELLADLKESYKFDSESWHYESDAISTVMDYAMRKGKLSDAFDGDVKQKVDEFLKYLGDLPTEYFEGKAQRAMGLSEFAAAVVPKSANKETKRILRDSGIKVRLYDDGDILSREEAIRGFDGLLFQSGKVHEEKRGSIQISPTRNLTINLLEKADLSTFVHELGHAFLEVTRDLAKATETDSQLAKDAEILHKWFGIKSLDDITVDHHEKFARGFEAYAMEGVAPSAELRGVFARFRSWLLAVYSSIKALQVNLNDDVRGVFDRMLATDEQIEAARKEAELTPIFTDAESAGMTDAGFTNYQDTVQKANISQREKLEQKLLKQWLREQQAWWKKELESTKTEVAKEVDLEKGFATLNAIKNGVLSDGSEVKIKLDAAALKENYTKEQMKRLRALDLYRVQDGVHPDVAAEALGYSSGDELVQSMLALPNRKETINTRSNELMRKRHGDIYTNMAELADRAKRVVLEGNQEEILQAELVALNKLQRKVKPFVDAEKKQQREAGVEGRKVLAAIPPVESFKRIAKGQISQQRIRDVQPSKYLMAMRRHGKAAMDALSKQDYQTATANKIKQTLNFHLYREALKMKNESAKMVNYLKSFSEKKKRQRLGKAGYLEQIESILERFDFMQVTQKDAEKRQALASWLEKQKEEGVPVNLDDRIMNEAYRKPFKEMTIEEMTGVYDSIKHLDHLARLKNKLLTIQDGRNFDEVISDIVSSIESYHERDTKARDYTPDEFGKRIKDFVNWTTESHAKPEFILDHLDGNKDGGPAWTTLFKPIVEAENAELKMQRETMDKLKSIMDPLKGEWFTQKTYIPAIKNSMNKATMIAVALNSGNEGNLAALKAGEKIDGEPWSDYHVKSILDNLTKEDWDMVQSIWDLIDEFWPQIAALEKDMTGIVPEKVSPTPVGTKFGSYRGGYYPLKYDPKISWSQFKRTEQQAMSDIFENHFAKAATKKGHTIERTKSGGQAVRLDLSVIGEHIYQVIHDVTHRKAIVDINRVIESNKFRSAVEQTVGRRAYEQFSPWLKAIANDTRQPSLPWEKVINHLRVGGTIVNMGWKFTTAIVQPLGYFQSMDFIGTKYAMIGLKEFYGSDMKSQIEFVMEKSEAMKNRQKTFDRDVREYAKKLQRQGKLDGIRESFFWMTGMLDMSVSMPTWLGAYRKAMEGQVEGVAANSDSDAVHYADKAVRESQSSGSVKDLASVQRGNEAFRAFTMFYSYFSALFNLLRKRVQDKRLDNINVAELAASMAMLWFIPAILGELVAGRGPDDDEDEATWALRQVAMYPMQTVIGVRDVANAALTPYGFSASPAYEGFEQTARAANIPYKVLTDEEITRADVKSAVLSAGYWGHLPGRQAWITGEYLFDLSSGDESPEDVLDFAKGVMFSRPASQRN